MFKRVRKDDIRTGSDVCSAYALTYARSRPCVWQAFSVLPFTSFVSPAGRPRGHHQCSRRVHCSSASGPAHVHADRDDIFVSILAASSRRRPSATCRRYVEKCALQPVLATRLRGHKRCFGNHGDSWSGVWTGKEAWL